MTGYKTLTGLTGLIAQLINSWLIKHGYGGLDVSPLIDAIWSFAFTAYTFYGQADKQKRLNEALDNR